MNLLACCAHSGLLAYPPLFLLQRRPDCMDIGVDPEEDWFDSTPG